jgi:pimeloyl-ACP methyl ester carboxylesterase
MGVSLRVWSSSRSGWRRVRGGSSLPGWLCLLVLLPWVMSAAAAPVAAGRIDLDAFEKLRRTVALPNGETLAYVELGDRAGAPVVLIHGYTDSARDWVPLVPYLSPRFRLILVDLRGHGHSGKPECCYTRLDFAYDVKLLLDHLRIRRADVVGHSLGSVIAQTFAEFWPERTQRVVLISSSAGLRPGAPPPKALNGAFAQIRKLEDPIDPDSPFMMEWWSSPTPVDAEFMRRQRADSAAIPARVWRAVLEQGLEPMFAGNELQATLPRLTAPTLLIWGSKDPLITADLRQPLLEGLPQAQVKIFEGLGHNPFWENPAACGELINSFLNEVPPASAAQP